MKWIQGKCKHVVMEDRYVINEDENNKEGDSIKNREYTYES